MRRAPFQNGKTIVTDAVAPVTSANQLRWRSLEKETANAQSEIHAEAKAEVEDQAEPEAEDQAEPEAETNAVAKAEVENEIRSPS